MSFTELPGRIFTDPLASAEGRWFREATTGRRRLTQSRQLPECEGKVNQDVYLSLPREKCQVIANERQWCTTQEVVDIIATRLLAEDREMAMTDYSSSDDELEELVRLSHFYEMKYPEVSG
jgi:hypothetical protein